MSDPTRQLTLKDCGRHYGVQPGPCAKCKYFAELQSDPKYQKYRKGLQYNGTPWLAVLGPPEPDGYIPHQDLVDQEQPCHNSPSTPQPSCN